MSTLPAPPITPGMGASWEEFRARLLQFARESRARRGQLLFRGQASAVWPLRTTLDRFRPLGDDVPRRHLVHTLLDEFRREAAVLRYGHDALPESDALELLGRHHGLPSPLLDWTESPYIASYFAFEGKHDGGPARIWVLDRTKLPPSSSSPPDVDLIDDRLLLRFNRRALQQRGVFLRVNTVRLPLEQILGPSLFAFDLPAADRLLALADLDVMNINGTTLFDDLDGVARTVQARVP